MAEKSSYLQIPSTVWWGLRKVLQRSPNATIDDKYLSVQLNVQDAAARQYIAELKRSGLIDENGKATELANRWRHDETYKEAVDELISINYPGGLIDISPPDNADRQKVVSWLIKEGLGSGTANNKAATYLLVGSPQPNDSTTRSVPARGRKEVARPASDRTSASTNSSTPKRQSLERPERSVPNSDIMPLNINIQIHVSADASTDQIESIFSAMRRHLYENSAP